MRCRLCKVKQCEEKSDLCGQCSSVAKGKSNIREALYICTSCTLGIISDIYNAPKFCPNCQNTSFNCRELEMEYDYTPISDTRKYQTGGDRDYIGMRKFSTGATRDKDTTKLDYDGFLSPLTLHSYAKYLHKHRIQSDGTYRDSDNWQKGIDKKVYMKSAWRHFADWWALHRGYYVYREKTDKGEVTHIRTKPLAVFPENWTQVSIEDALNGIIFNSSGYLHEYLKSRS